MPRKYLLPKMQNNIIFYIDFDGTITDIDTLNFLLEWFTGDKWLYFDKFFLEGKMSSFECITEQVGLMKKVTKGDMLSAVKDVKIDQHFKKFLKESRGRGYNIEILSDGLDVYIEGILSQNGLRNLKIKSNKYLGGGKVEFPYRKNLCEKECGNCKKSHINKNLYSIYIGDGRSDFCAAECCDLIFAKNSLALYLEKTKKKYSPFKDFLDVCNSLYELGIF